MIEVFQNDDFTLDFEVTDGVIPNGSKWFCQIVDDKPEQTPSIEEWHEVQGDTKKFSADLSAKNLTPSEKFAPYQYYVRLTIINVENKQSTVFQELLVVKEMYK